MRIVHQRCGVLDVHKKTIVACVLVWDGKEAIQERKREFGTTKRQLQDLRFWLTACKVTEVAMESTGVYWKPVWNALAHVPWAEDRPGRCRVAGVVAAVRTTEREPRAAAAGAGVAGPDAVTRGAGRGQEPGAEPDREAARGCQPQVGKRGIGHAGSEQQTDTEGRNRR